ncbi:MAG: glycosyltransferase family 4 protein [Bdellovibrionales bacterium]
MITILQIIPALGTGGAEQACVDMAKALVARGDKALIVSSGGRRVAEAQESGAVHFLRNAQTKNPFRIIQNAFWLAGLIRAQKVDIVHARSRAPAWSAWIACRMTGCPYVTTFHAAYKFSSKLKKFYNRVMARGVRVIAISPFIRNHIHENYGVPFARIPLINRGVDVKAFDPEKIPEDRRRQWREAWGIHEGDNLVLLPGRLSPIKNHDLILDAMELLEKDKQPIVCFVGDDQGREAYSEHLLKRIAEAGLSEVVKLVGACSDMPAVLSLASLVVMPSKVPEGFGRVPVEAMAMGVPVIASNLGATRETVIDGETGWLLPPQDPEVWATFMEKALSMSEKEKEKMAQAARARVLQSFSHDGMIAQTLAVYDEVIKEGLAA